MIIHVDMDAFYASVEQRDQPALRGKPVIVGGTVEGRGVVSAASYEARRFGVHSAMPAAQARRLCPHAVFLPVRMHHYAAISGQILEILGAFSPLVEPLSLDEAFLDVRGCEQLMGSADRMGRRIKSRILKETGLICSVGIAPNKFVAKVASDLGKPNGFVVVAPGEIDSFLAPLPVTRLWGVGAKAERSLRNLGIETIAQLAALPAKYLSAEFGESGRQLWKLAHGEDPRPVVSDRSAASLSSETTFPRDISNRAVLRSIVLELTEQVARRLRRANLRARTVELKVRTWDFRTFTRSHTLREPTNLTTLIWKTVAQLFDCQDDDKMLPARLLGVALTSLTATAQLQGDLFDRQDHLKQHGIDQVSDQVVGRFGPRALRRGQSIRKP